MRVVHTWSFKPWLYFCSWQSTHLLMTCIKQSVESANQFYGRPTIYTDEFSLPFLQNLDLPADYEIVEYDPVLSKYWNYPKLVTYSLQKEPFIHLDLDMLHWKAMTPEHLSYPVGTHGQELPELMDEIYTKTTDTILWLPPIFYQVDDLESTGAYHMPMVYFNDMELCARYSADALAMIHNNIDNYDAVRKQYHVVEVIFEQQLMACYLKDREHFYMSDWNTADSNLNEYYWHFSGNMKNRPDVVAAIKKYRSWTTVKATIKLLWYKYRYGIRQEGHRNPSKG